MAMHIITVLQIECSMRGESHGNDIAMGQRSCSGAPLHVEATLSRGLL